MEAKLPLYVGDIVEAMLDVAPNIEPEDWCLGETGVTSSFASTISPT
jgi:hypothetical protein